MRLRPPLAHKVLPPWADPNQKPVYLLDWLGFTGTRRGMTKAQLGTIEQWVKIIRPNSVVHGCCWGADMQFHDLCSTLMVKIALRPSNRQDLIPGLGGCVWSIAPAEEPLVRNRKIVADAQWLLAAPAEEQEILRSGTWATIRYARKKPGMNVTVVYPSGRYQTTHIQG